MKLFLSIKSSSVYSSFYMTPYFLQVAGFLATALHPSSKLQVSEMQAWRW